MTLRVVAFTDESVAQLGVQALLARDPSFHLICVCPNQAELFASLKHHPDVILYSFRSDQELSVVRNLRRAAQSSAIVLWSREFSPELVHHALELGIRGFLSTTASPQTVKECLHACGARDTWMERSLSVALLNAPPLSLSRRQSQLIGLLVQGLKNKEIAAALSISEGTVKAYLTTLFEKVGAKDRFELALFGMKNLGSLHEHVHEPADPHVDTNFDTKDVLVTRPRRAAASLRRTRRPVV